MPTVFFIFRLLNIYSVFDPVYGHNPTATGWGIVSLLQIIPIIILAIVVLKYSLTNKYEEVYK